MRNNNFRLNMAIFTKYEDLDLIWSFSPKKAMFTKYWYYSKKMLFSIKYGHFWPNKTNFWDIGFHKAFLVQCGSQISIFPAPRTERLWCVGTWYPPLYHYPANAREKIWFWPNLVIFEHWNIFKIEKKMRKMTKQSLHCGRYV